MHAARIGSLDTNASCTIVPATQLNHSASATPSASFEAKWWQNAPLVTLASRHSWIDRSSGKTLLPHQPDAGLEQFVAGRRRGRAEGLNRINGKFALMV